MDDHANDNELPDLEQLVDLLVYAPIGLLYEYQTVLPQLIKRGKSQVQLARIVGQFAVKQGSKQVNRQSAQVAESALGVLAGALTDLGSSIGLAPPTSGAGPATEQEDASSSNGRSASNEAGDTAKPAGESDEGPSAVRLPIAGYDQLTARSIVELLDDLTPAQLERVRRYEADNRNRKTVLSKIDRLTS